MTRSDEDTRGAVSPRPKNAVAISRRNFSCEDRWRKLRQHSGDEPCVAFTGNKDDDLILAIGDRVDVYEWSAAPFAAASTLTNAIQLVISNVISNTAAASAGNVNAAEVFLATSLFSSGT